MNNQLLLLSVISVALVGCGGGSGNSNVIPVSAAPLKVFGDGAGVLKVTMTATNEKMYGIVPEVAAIATEFTSGGISTDPGAIISSFPIVNDTLTYAVVRQGTFTIGDTSANVTVYEDRQQKSLVLVVDSGTVSFVLTAGNGALTNIPTGSFDYVGTWGGAPRSGGSEEVGDFSMTADFTNGLVNFNGSTLNTTLVGTNMSLDTLTGDFAANNAVFSYNTTNKPSSIYGSFSGSGASGVHGVWHSNDEIDAGAFAGHRL